MGGERVRAGKERAMAEERRERVGGRKTGRGGAGQKWEGGQGDEGMVVVWSGWRGLCV